MTVDNIRLLRGIRLFSELTSQELMMVLLESQSMWFGAGDLIIREESEGDALFVIKTGQVRIAKYDGRGTERELAILQKSEHFGEIALIENKPRSASAYAHTDCELLRLPRKFYKAFTLLLAERLRRLNDNFTFCQEMGDLIHEVET
jgi:CRP/FNR family cyclic AMP-dependent transcriptional regulator